MEAVFKVNPLEFDEVIQKIRKFLFHENSERMEITISVRDVPVNAKYFEELDKSIAEYESGTDCVTFTLDEFREFYQAKSSL